MTEATHDEIQVSTREVPWMKLGKLVEQPLTAAEAARAGGLDFTVVKRPLWYGDSDDPLTSLPTNRVEKRVATVRSDTNEWLGIMGADYPILQYREAFDFMDTINPEYVACGALKGGRQGFMVVRAPETATLDIPWDPHDLFAVLRTSHDGSRAVEVSVMPLRAKCMNQLTLRSFSAGVDYRWAIPHTTTMQAKLAEAQKSLVKLGVYAQRYAHNAERMRAIKLDNDSARSTLEAVLPNRPRREQQVEEIISRWHTAETVGFDWTGWGLLNAASDYFEWGRAGGSAESRFVGALQGSTHQVINKITGRLLSRSPA